MCLKMMNIFNYLLSTAIPFSPTDCISSTVRPVYCICVSIKLHGHCANSITKGDYYI